MNNDLEYIEIKDNIDKETAKKIKKLLKKYKITQDEVIESVSAVILKSIDDNGVYILSESMIAELRDGISKHFNEFSADETEYVKKLLSDAYEKAYVGTAGVIASDVAIGAVGIKASWNLVRQEMIDRAVNNPLEGKMFSSRIWENTNRLAQRIYDDVLDCVKTGKRYNEIARKIKKDFGVSSYEAARLVNTELSRVVSEAQIQVYENSGVVDKVMWMATLEGNTCDYCADMDGQIFDLRKAPKIPEHPNCRCTYIPIVDGYTPSERADNETHKIISYQTYKEWRNNK